MAGTVVGIVSIGFALVFLTGPADTNGAAETTRTPASPAASGLEAFAGPRACDVLGNDQMQALGLSGPLVRESSSGGSCAWTMTHGSSLFYTLAPSTPWVRVTSEPGYTDYTVAGREAYHYLVRSSSPPGKYCVVRSRLGSGEITVFGANVEDSVSDQDTCTQPVAVMEAIARRFR